MSFWRNFGQLVEEFAGPVYQDGMSQSQEVQEKIRAAMADAQEMETYDLEDKFINEQDKYVKAGYAKVLEQKRR